MHYRSVVVCSWAGLLIVTSWTVASANDYRYYDLGDLGSTEYTDPLDVSDNGTIVGQSSDVEGNPRAFSWSNGAMTDISHIWDDGWVYFISGISEPGAMIGWGDVYGQGFEVLLLRDGYVSILPWPDGYGQNWFPFRINDAGTFAVGYCETADGQLDYFLPTLYDLEQISSVSLGFPLGAPEGTNSKAYGVNNDGVVVGIMNYPDETDRRAFAWSAGVMTELINTLGGNDIAAIGVNNHGIVAGSGETNIDDFAIQYDLNNGAMTAMAEDAEARAINDHNQAVGIAIVGGLYRPFLFSEQENIDLLPFLPDGSEGIANAINNYGWIVGEGFDFDKSISFWGWLLVPLYDKGDFDGDEDVDLQDFGHFQRCFAAQPYIDGTLHVGCSVFDFDDDVDLDLTDYQAFQAAFTGP